MAEQTPHIPFENSEEVLLTHLRNMINTDKHYGFYQLCPKCDGEGVLQGPQYDGATVTFGGTCHVCNGAKLLVRPEIKDIQIK